MANSFFYMGMADVMKPARIQIPGKMQNEMNIAPTPTPNKIEAGQESDSSISISDSSNDKCPATKLARSMTALQRVVSENNIKSINNPPLVSRTQSCPQLKPYDDCKEFFHFFHVCLFCVLFVFLILFAMKSSAFFNRICFYQIYV